MPYQAFRAQSRVEFIKKKFENLRPDGNDTESLKRNNLTALSTTNCLQELKDLNLGHKTVNLKSETNFVNKSGGKTVVKRSPAFRREKLGLAKSLTQVSFHGASTSMQPPCENHSDNAQDTILNETKVQDVNMWKDLKRSKTDTNLLKYCSSRAIDKKIVQINSKNVEVSNSFICTQNRESECDIGEGTFNQYSVVNKNINKPEKNEIVNLRFSESIRKALQTPLPKGPPPKKPPRTFCHAPSFTRTNTLMTTISTSSTATKSDIPKLKTKLEKLEKVIRIHETGILAHKKKVNFSEPTPEVSKTCKSCLPVSQCLSQDAEISNNKKASKTENKFYSPVEKVNSNSVEFGKYLTYVLGSAKDQQQSNISSPEAIYDLPCLTNKKGFETFGKSSKDLKDSVNTKKAEGLHYMCTNVINQTPEYLNLSHNVSTKNTEERSLIDNWHFKSNFLASVEDDVSSMRKVVRKRFSNVREEEKKSQSNKEHTCAAREESCGESDSDVMTVHSSDCIETKKSDEGDNLSCITGKRKFYVSSGSSKFISQIPCWKYKSKNSSKHLFECCLLVGLTLCESKESVPYIKSIFPPNTKPPPLIESLCFPDACYWPSASENQHPEEQYYSLVVTNENGERKFGYCRRVLPEGGYVCLPLAYCIITPHRAGGFFYKVLEELESKHGSPVVENFIKQLYESEFPGPGERLKLKEILEEATKTSQLDSDNYLSSTLVRRPPDLRLEEKDLTQLFRHLQLSVLLKVFASLLLERKVLFLSDSLRTLASCIEALQSILLPFSWQHTCIPVLPVHLTEMCEAPTPYLIGLLKPRYVEKSLSNVNFENGILVDLDDSKILKCCGDEGSILPLRLIKDLKMSLNLAMNSSDLLSESVRSVLISDAFIRFFVQVCGHYSKFIQSFPNGGKVFQKEEFIKSVTSNATQSFLDRFTETGMFNSFIQERLQGDDEDMLVKLFRRRAMEYSEDSIRDSALLLKNYRVLNKKVKTLSGKIKDFTSFAK